MVDDLRYMDIVLDNSKLTIGVKFLVYIRNCEGGSISFQSTNTDIASILPYEDGLYNGKSACYILPKNPGKFGLVITKGNVKRYYKFVVGTYESSASIPTSPHLYFRTDELVMPLGSTYRLAAETHCCDDIHYHSTDDSVATVDHHGNVTALSIGSVRIIANNAGLHSICNVKVEGLSTDSDKYDMVVNQTLLINVNLGAANGTKLYWESSDSSIAEVDKHTGLITGRSLGECSVTVTAVTEGKPTTKVFKINVRKHFQPITNYRDIDTSTITIYDSKSDMFSRNARSFFKVEPATPTVPKLYYFETKSDPYIFYYKVCAVDSDIDKFLLSR